MLISNHLSSNIITCIFFYLTHLRELGQKYKNFFVRFLVQMKTSKLAFEINWPLPVLQTLVLLVAVVVDGSTNAFVLYPTLLRRQRLVRWWSACTAVYTSSQHGRRHVGGVTVGHKDLCCSMWTRGQSDLRGQPQAAPQPPPQNQPVAAKKTNLVRTQGCWRGKSWKKYRVSKMPGSE